MKRTDIERLLPGVFQRTAQEGTPLFALLEAMEALQAPDENVLDQLEAFFDPYRAPDAFVPFLATWVDLGWLLGEEAGDLAGGTSPPLASGLGRLRELVAAAVPLARWRGTSKGLLGFLETATGIQGFAIDEQVADASGRVRPFHIRLSVPAEAAVYRMMIERIVEAEKPAYVTCEFQVIGNARSQQPVQRGA